MAEEAAAEQQQSSVAGDRYFPTDIVREILNRLPLTSLARFNCVSKPWLVLVADIINHRLREEMDRRLCKLDEICQNLLSLQDEVDGLSNTNVAGLRRFRDRLKGKMDEALSLVSFRSDIDRFHSGVNRMDGVFESLVPYASGVLAIVDRLIDIAAEQELLLEEVADA